MTVRTFCDFCGVDITTSRLFRLVIHDEAIMVATERKTEYHSCISCRESIGEELSAQAKRGGQRGVCCCDLGQLTSCCGGTTNPDCGYHTFCEPCEYYEPVEVLCDLCGREWEGSGDACPACANPGAFEPNRPTSIDRLIAMTEVRSNE